MSELPGSGSVPARGIRNVLQAGVGGRSRAREAREGALAGASRPMARAPGPATGSEPVSIMGSVPEPLGLLATHEQQQQLQQQLFRQYLDDCSLIPARLLRDIEERRRLFVEGCRAREAAFDADPPPMDSAAAAFTVALGASDN